MVDKFTNAAFQLAWQVIILQQDFVLHRAMPPLDLPLGHRMVRLATGVRHAVFSKPAFQLSADIARPVIAQQAWPVLAT